MNSISGLHRVDFLATSTDILEYHLEGGILPDENGNVPVTGRDGHSRIVPLKGLYAVRPLDPETPWEGPGVLITPEDFVELFAAELPGSGLTAA